MSKTSEKKCYKKPELTRIELKGEEIFLANCKLTSGGTTTSARSGRCSSSTRCRSTRGTS